MSEDCPKKPFVCDIGVTHWLKGKSVHSKEERRSYIESFMGKIFYEIEREDGVVFIFHEGVFQRD